MKSDDLFRSNKYESFSAKNEMGSDGLEALRLLFVFQLF